MLSEYSKFRLKRRWRRVIRHGQRRADDIQRNTQRHFWRRIRNLKTVRRFLLSWWVLWAVMVLGVSLQLSTLYQSYTSITPVSGGVFVEGAKGKITNMNPIFATSPADASASRLIFNGLLRYDGQGELVGDLAEAWSYDKSGTAFTVRLRPDITWHDGEAFTSEDVVYTYTIVQHPDTRSPLNTSWRGIEVIAQDDLTVVFRLPNPFAPFPHALTTGIVPEHILGPLGPNGQRASEYNQAPIGTGPFVFSELDSESDTLRLSANENYFKGRPLLDAFQLKTYESSGDLLQAYQSGILDSASDLSIDDLDIVDQLTRRYELKEVNTTNATFAFFNMRRGLLKDNDIRQALVRSTDPNAVLRSLDFRQSVLFGPLLTHQLSYNKSLAQLPYDLDKARSQLDKSGWGLGQDGIRRKGGDRLSIDLVASNTSDSVRLADALKDTWRKAGVEVNVTTLPGTELYSSHILPHNYYILIHTIPLGADPDIFPYWHSSQAKSNSFNFSEYKDEIADDSLEAGRTRLDDALRAAKYRAFLKAWREDAPAVALTSHRDFYLQGPDVTTFSHELLILPQSRYGEVETWTVRSEWR